MQNNTTIFTSIQPHPYFLPHLLHFFSGNCTRFFSTFSQYGKYGLRILRYRFPFLAERAEKGFDIFDECFLQRLVLPSVLFVERVEFGLGAKAFVSPVRAEKLMNLIDIFRNARGGIGNDTHDELFNLGILGKEWNGISITLAHLATVYTGD